MAVVRSLKRRVVVALAVLAPCLLFPAIAEASPGRKAHVRAHRVTRHTVSPTQAFAQLAAKRPERRVYRHPPTWLKKSHGVTPTDDHDAAIQTASLASADAPHEVPALRPLELLVPVQAQIQSHDGFAPSSPREPPVFS